MPLFRSAAKHLQGVATCRVVLEFKGVPHLYIIYLIHIKPIGLLRVH